MGKKMPSASAPYRLLETTSAEQTAAAATVHVRAPRNARKAKPILQGMKASALVCGPSPHFTSTFRRSGIHSSESARYALRNANSGDSSASAHAATHAHPREPDPTRTRKYTPATPRQ